MKLYDRLAFSLALRGLRFNRGQTLLTVGVVAISVSLIIFLGSLIGGLQSRLIENITGPIAHVEVTPPEREARAVWELPDANDQRLIIGELPRIQQRQETIEQWSQWVDRIEEMDPSITVVSPVVQGQGFLSRGAQREAVALLGVIPERHNQQVQIEENLVAGRFLDLGPSEIAIGQNLADDFDVAHGDRLRLLSGAGNSGNFTVGGVFDTGFSQIDGATVFMTLGDAQSLFGVGGDVTMIGMQIEGIFGAEELSARLERQLPFQITPWTEERRQLLTALQAQTQSTVLIIVFTTIAAGFAIASILVMLVVSKLREIGILKAMGATSRQIVGIFALQGTLMAGLGAIVGTITGTAISLGVAQVRTEQDTQVFPIEVTYQIILIAIIVALTVGFLASLIPARRAARVDPIEVIRGA